MPVGSGGADDSRHSLALQCAVEGATAPATRFVSVGPGKKPLNP